VLEVQVMRCTAPGGELILTSVVPDETVAVRDESASTVGLGRPVGHRHRSERQELAKSKPHFILFLK
jgi:hypothetical protein